VCGCAFQLSLLCLRPHRAEALSDAFVRRLSVTYIGPNSRTDRHRRTKIGTEVANVTRDSDTTFKKKKVKGQLVADVLNSQYAGTGATWRINAKILSTCIGRRNIVSPRARLVLNCSCYLSVFHFSVWPKWLHVMTTIYYYSYTLTTTTTTTTTTATCSFLLNRPIFPEISLGGISQSSPKDFDDC